MRHTFPREFYIKKGSVKVADKQSDAVAYLWTVTRKGALPGDTGHKRYGATIFFGKQAKPVSDFYYVTEAARNKAVETAFANNRAHKARKAEQVAKRKAWVPSYKVGDVFRTSWGYEQTNVEFFEVTEVRGKHLILRQIAATTEQNGPFSGRCRPLPGQFLKPRFEGDDQGIPIRRLAQEHGVKIDDVRTAWLVKDLTATHHYSWGH